MVVDITLSSPTLSPINETMVDFVSKFGARPTRRPLAPRIRLVLHPSALFEIARDPIDQLAVYARHCPKRNIKASSCGTH